ncbi:MAG: PilZ domain-containing protein [Candidatus Aureabacteria bacterium]|nr:PilZ domain-containing protein [Candidatus Auribacterota bacterium]
MNDEFIEKRKYIRFEAQTSINVQLHSKGYLSPEKILGLTKNMSVEGVCFISEKEFRSGDILTLQVKLPNQSESLALEGEVRWCKTVSRGEIEEKFETGVKLFTVEKSDETKFVGYVNYKLIQRLKKKD